jgi:parallel beta-helix repeat protein
MALRRLTRFTLGLALTLVIAALVSAPAFASHVHCGDVLTQDTTLDSDLVGCAGDGLVVGADGITLNLNGHLIEGTGPGNGSDVIYGDTRDGVDNAAGHRGVTIENGEIGNFDTGVKLDEADSNRIQGVATHENLVGVILVESSGARVESNYTYRNSYGIYLVESNGNRVTGNRSDANTFALYTVEASDNVIWNNSASGSSILGFQISTSSNHNWIRGNTVIGSSSVGLLVSGSTDARVEDNLFQDHRSAGIQFVDADRGLAQRNRVVNTAFAKGSLGGGIQVFFGSDDLTLSRNEVVDYGDGITLDGSPRVALSRNEVRGNAVDGIRVGSQASATLLDRNVATSNGDDGLDVKDGSAAVSRNVANSNGDYGIEAVPGVDRDGNKAAGNGNPAQCLNVSCN